MKLTYNLLWFDDEPRMVKTSERRLVRMLREKGFALKIAIRTDISPAAIEELGGALAQYNPYDIIVFDHDLGTRKGTDIAQSLRRKVFTDMVYYSAAPLDSLRKAIYDAKIDGVFLINKHSCVDDLMRILEDHIKKNCDLNSMRGIVLDTLCEMEVSLRRYLILKLQNDPALRLQRLDRFKDRISKRGKQFQTTAEKMTEERMLSWFADPLKSDFNTIRQTLFSCETDWDILQDDHALHALQNLRNVLAHESYEWDSHNNCVTVHIDGQVHRYRSPDFEGIRKQLLTVYDEIRTHCKDCSPVSIDN